MIAKGLHDRFIAIKSNPYTNENEHGLLNELDGLFCPDKKTFVYLSASRILGVAIARDLDPDMRTIAHYVSIMFGQTSFPHDTYLKKIYISMFGNIHLVNEQMDKPIKVTAPLLTYNQVGPQNCIVSPLLAMLSGLAAGYSELNRGGFDFIEDLGSYLLVSEDYTWDNSVILPKAVSAINLITRTGSFNATTCSLVGRAYHAFFYGSLESIDIIRHPVFLFIIDHMVKMMGESHRNYIIPPTSIYRKILDNSTVRGSQLKRPMLLNFALEALGPEPDSPDSEKKDTPSEEETVEEPKMDPETDPSTEDGGFDPSVPPPAEPTGEESTAKDTIELISFDKTGEGVEEDLYRTAVVVLNTQFKNNESIAVPSEVKASLDQWVNGYLYRSAISATKDRIKNLGLQKYFKTFN